MNLKARSKSVFSYGAGVTAMLLFVAGAFFPAQLSASYTGMHQPLAVDRVVSLGDVPVGKTTTREISLLNAHLSTVIIQEAGASCGCTLAKTKSDTIAPFRRGAIFVSVTPTRIGEGSQDIELKTNHGAQQIEVRYNVVSNVAQATKETK